MIERHQEPWSESSYEYFETYNFSVVKSLSNSWQLLLHPPQGINFASIRHLTNVSVHNIFFIAAIATLFE